MGRNHRMQKRKPQTDIIQIISIVGSNLIIMFTFFGVAISLHLSSRDELRAIQQEIKDFHCKLCVIQEKGKI